VVVRARSRRPVVAAAGGERRFIEGVDQGSAVHPGTRREQVVCSACRG
jgi:hypothetical protein